MSCSTFKRKPVILSPNYPDDAKQNNRKNEKIKALNKNKNTF
jgi:hypothetical protein